MEKSFSSLRPQLTTTTQPRDFGGLNTLRKRRRELRGNMSRILWIFFKPMGSLTSSRSFQTAWKPAGLRLYLSQWRERLQARRLNHSRRDIELGIQVNYNNLYLCLRLLTLFPISQVSNLHSFRLDGVKAIMNSSLPFFLSFYYSLSRCSICWISSDSTQYCSAPTYFTCLDLSYLILVFRVRSHLDPVDRKNAALYKSL